MGAGGRFNIFLDSDSDNFEHMFRDTQVADCSVFRQYRSLCSTTLGRYTSREIQNWSPTKNDVIETTCIMLTLLSCSAPSTTT